MGFTLVEVLVALGIIGVLLGILVPALASLRSSAVKMEEMGAASQVIAAYIMRADDNDGRLMPGVGWTGVVLDANGRQINDADFVDPPEFIGPSSRYPWRLAPYLDYQFRSLFLNSQAHALEAVEQDDYLAYVDYVSRYPSFGLNGFWVGGNSPEMLANPDLLLYNDSTVYSMTEANRPDRLLVFASSRSWDPDEGAEVEGGHTVCSPIDQYVDGMTLDCEGVVSFRHGGEAVCAFMDGHAAGKDENELLDMRYWSNDATRPDWPQDP